MKSIVIIGAGGFAKEVAWLIDEINEKNHDWNLLGFIYENPDNIGQIVNGYPILGDFEWLEGKENIYYVCAVGNPWLRKRLIEKGLKYNHNLKAATLIHPTVKISKHSSVGEGSIIGLGNIITVNAQIGKHVVLYLDCTICHDSIIEDYSIILPSCNVSGNVHIGELCEVGAGTTIIEKKHIGRETIIGAGAVVISDLPPYCTAVGVPARVIKSKE